MGLHRHSPRSSRSCAASIRPQRRRAAVSEPAQHGLGCAAFAPRKLLITEEGFTSSSNKPASSNEVKPEPANGTLIIGFDSEWVAELPDPPDDDAGADD